MFTLVLLVGIAAAVARLLWLLPRLRPDQSASIAPIRWWWLALAALLVQVAVIAGWLATPTMAARAAPVLATQALVLAAALGNWRRAWMWLVIGGLVLNLLVMAANGGLMPITPDTLVRAGDAHVLARVAVGQPLPRSKDVILAPDNVRLSWLSDRLVVPGRPNSFSIGDVLIALGILLVLQSSIRVDTRSPGGEGDRAWGPRDHRTGRGVHQVGPACPT